MRDKILGLADLPQETIVIPEWGDQEVHVRGLTAGEVEGFGNEINAKGGPLNFLASIVVKVVVDELGQRIFGDDDVEAMAGKNAQAVKRIFDKAQELSGLGEGEDTTGN